MSDSESEFDMDVSIGTDKLEQLHKLADECVLLESKIKDQEGVLSATKAAYQFLKSQSLPRLQMELQQPLFVYKNRQFDLNNYVSGSLPKEEPERSAAYAYLDELKAEGLIKTVLSIAFGKTQHNEALDLYEQLKESGYPVEIETGIHAQTLQAFARRMLEDGEEIDWEKLGLFVGKITRIDELDPKTGKKLAKKRKFEDE